MELNDGPAEFADIHEASETAAQIRLRDVRAGGRRVGRRGGGRRGRRRGALPRKAASVLCPPRWSMQAPALPLPPSRPTPPPQSWARMFTRAYSPMLVVTCMIAMLQQVGGPRGLSRRGWAAAVLGWLAGRHGRRRGLGSARAARAAQAAPLVGGRGPEPTECAPFALPPPPAVDRHQRHHVL